MFNKVKERTVAAFLALAMAVTAVPAGGVVEAEAANKTNVMEAKVNFTKNPNTGDDSNVCLNFLVSNEDITFGKTYALNMKVYVPEAFMKDGSIFISPRISFWTGEDLNTEAGWGENEDGFFFENNSTNVTKQNDFYVIDAKMPIEKCYVNEAESSFPEGKGQVIGEAFVVGDGNYKGSIYFDDIELVVDNNVVASANYENKNIGSCTYSMNRDFDHTTKPKVVSFSGKALEVFKTTLSVKKGKTTTIKATAMPAGKITYTSSNKKVATVTSKGVVKGIKKGKATITVKANGKTIKVKVTVK